MGTYLPKPLTNKKFHSQNCANFNYTLCEMQGWRRQMEDAAICEPSLGDGNSLFAVFDGHSGNEVSTYVKSIFKEMLLKNQFYEKGQYQNAMISTFQKIDQILRSDEGQMELMKLRLQNKKLSLNNQKQNQRDRDRIGNFTGCTANVVLITPLVYVVANCGDSRSVFCRKGKAIQMSFDHKPQNASQCSRIYNAGASIIKGRVNGNLNLSRGFGDFRYKDAHMRFDETIITCMPQVKIFARSPEDQFIIVGCDGIFERYTIDSQPIVKFIRRQIKQKKKGEKILTKIFDLFLAKTPNQVFGCDNMTAILIQF